MSNKLGASVALALSALFLGLYPSRAQQPNVVNGRIVFISNRDGNYEIYTMNQDGTNQVRLTNNAGRDSHPDWSPDGTQIAFQSNRDGLSNIFVMLSDGSQVVNLTQGSSTGYVYPSWSPDGTKIAFSSYDENGANIFIINADGTDLTQLTYGENAKYSLHPTWSPDGDQLLVSTTNEIVGVLSGSNPEFTFQLIDLMTKQATDLYPVGSEGAPDWSWTRDEIVYYDASLFNNIRRISSDGIRLASLTDEPDLFADIVSSDEDPSWSPDGTMLTYAASLSTPDDRVNTDYDIYIIELETGNKINLTGGNHADDRQPDWQPVFITNSP